MFNDDFLATPTYVLRADDFPIEGDFDYGFPARLALPVEDPFPAPPLDVKKLYIVKLVMNGSGGKSIPLNIKVSISIKESFVCNIRIINPCF